MATWVPSRNAASRSVASWATPRRRGLGAVDDVGDDAVHPALAERPVDDQPGGLGAEAPAPVVGDEEQADLGLAGHRVEAVDPDGPGPDLPAVVGPGPDQEVRRRVVADDDLLVELTLVVEVQGNLWQVRQGAQILYFDSHASAYERALAGELPEGSRPRCIPAVEWRDGPQRVGHS